MLAHGLEGTEDGEELRGEAGLALAEEGRGDAVVGLGEATGDGCECVAVAAEGDGRADGVLEVRALQEGRDGLRDGLLAALHVVVGGADLVAGAGEIVAEFTDDEVLHLGPGDAVPEQENGGRHGLGALDALGVIVRDFGGPARDFAGTLEGGEGPAHGRDAHGGAVAVAAVGLRIG